MMPIETADEAVAEANALPFGLAAYAFTNSMKLAYRFANEIQSGVVCINELQASLPETPFGGYKDSGLGSEGGVEGLREFLRVTRWEERRVGQECVGQCRSRSSPDHKTTKKTHKDQESK